MKKQTVVKFLSQGFILFSASALLIVSVMALMNPQSVMDLVKVELKNTDAISSIRGIYGGVGLSLVISLLYLMANNIPKGLLYLCMLWGLYAISRMITVLVEGALGDFGTNWLYMESVFFLISMILLLLNKVKDAAKSGNLA